MTLKGHDLGNQVLVPLYFFNTMNEGILSFELDPEHEFQLSKKFKVFQRQYLAVYLTVMGNIVKRKTIDNIPSNKAL